MNITATLSKRMIALIMVLFAVMLLPFASMAEEAGILYLTNGNSVEFTADGETETVIEFQTRDDVYTELKYELTDVTEYEITYSYMMYENEGVWRGPYYFDESS